jgi:hypothetical protein
MDVSSSRRFVVESLKPQIRTRLDQQFMKTRVRGRVGNKSFQSDIHYREITACTAVQCSVMDDSAFLWEHAIFGPRHTVTP